MSMTDAALIARSAAEQLVEREEIESGSRMNAYHSVARKIGVSPSWLRKFVSGHPDAKEPRWSIGLKIITEYRKLCERIEADTQRRLLRARTLREEIDAAMSGVDRLDEGLADRKVR